MQSHFLTILVLSGAFLTPVSVRYDQSVSKIFFLEAQVRICFYYLSYFYKDQAHYFPYLVCKAGDTIFAKQFSIIISIFDYNWEKFSIFKDAYN